MKYKKERKLLAIMMVTYLVSIICYRVSPLYMFLMNISAVLEVKTKRKQNKTKENK